MNVFGISHCQVIYVKYRFTQRSIFMLNSFLLTLAYFVTKEHGGYRTLVLWHYFDTGRRQIQISQIQNLNHIFAYYLIGLWIPLKLLKDHKYDTHLFAELDQAAHTWSFMQVCISVCRFESFHNIKHFCCSFYNVLLCLKKIVFENRRRLIQCVGKKFNLFGDTSKINVIACSSLIKMH